MTLVKSEYFHMRRDGHDTEIVYFLSLFGYRAIHGTTALYDYHKLCAGNSEGLYKRFLPYMGVPKCDGPLTGP